MSRTLWHDINEPSGLLRSSGEKYQRNKAQEKYLTDSMREQEIEIEPIAAQPKEPPEVRLSAPEFIEPPEGFAQNKPCKIRVKAEFLKQSNRTRVLFDIFSEYNGAKVTEHAGLEGYIGSDGFAVADVKHLFFNDNFLTDEEKPTDAQFETWFTARHSKGEADVTSVRLNLPVIKQIKTGTVCAKIINCSGIPVAGAKCILRGASREIGEKIADIGGVVKWDELPLDEYFIKATVSSQSGEFAVPWTNGCDMLHICRFIASDCLYGGNEDAKAIQGMLLALGFDCGSIDGIIGPKTKKAIRDFQRVGGLTVDGICSQNTKKALYELAGIPDRG